jgi:hypothetical protein
MLPFVFIHAGGLQGEANIFTVVPAAARAALMNGRRWRRSGWIEKWRRSTSPGTSS